MKSKQQKEAFEEERLKMQAKLSSWALCFDVPDHKLKAAMRPLQIEEFLWYPATKSGKHHAAAGDLLRHTGELVDYCRASSQAFPQLDQAVLMVGCMWHDFGKTLEYSCKLTPAMRPGSAFGEVTTSPAGALSHHITLGVGAWELYTYTHLSTDPGFTSAVRHCIEAHHGRREWGSPSTPKTPEAMMIHHADMMSVMLDCGINPENR